MQRANTFIRASRPDRPLLLALCLMFSILLHLLVVLSIPLIMQQTANRFISQQPTIVRLVDRPERKPKPDQPLEYELDQKPPPSAEPKPENAKRLAERNQRVEKEQAPRGIDARDQQARPEVSPKELPAAKPQQAPLEEQKQAKNNALKKESYDSSAEKLLSDKQGAIKQPVQAEPLPQNPPTLEQLTRLAPDTLDRLSKEGRSTQEKIKQRDNVERGDEVWLNLEEGLLISFFRRFRNQIEGVWNYPLQAVEQGIEGTLLLKITVNPKGELLDVDLLNSSGSDLLDYEAIQAVYRGAPFGPLPKQFPYPEVKIYAHFSYTIANKFIYGH